MIGGGTRQLELLREHRRQNAGQEDVEEIKERTDARDDCRVAVSSRRRKPIQPRGD
jgi:hypothetical protein